MEDTAIVQLKERIIDVACQIINRNMKGTIAKKLGVYSKASGGKASHAQAIGEIISQLELTTEEREAVPYSRNGHDGADFQYTERVIDKIRSCLETRDWPNTTSAGSKNYLALYRMAETASLENRILEEERRLEDTFEDLPEKKKAAAQGLVRRAAFMRVSLEEELNRHGFTEWFSQGGQEPYLRERPTSKVYCTLNANYQKIVKQLTELLPKEEGPAAGVTVLTPSSVPEAVRRTKAYQFAEDVAGGRIVSRKRRIQACRRFREGIIIVGQGNGKSTLIAGNDLYGLTKDHERGAVYCLANSREQARIISASARPRWRPAPSSPGICGSIHRGSSLTRRQESSSPWRRTAGTWTGGTSIWVSSTRSTSSRTMNLYSQPQTTG